MDENMRLVMAGMERIDARLKSLQKIGLYVATVLTALLVVVLMVSGHLAR